MSSESSSRDPKTPYVDETRLVYCRSLTGITILDCELWLLQSENA